MKPIFSCLILLLLISSCTQETPASDRVEAMLRVYYGSPENPDNPYDSVGRIQNAVLDSYMSSASLPATVSGIAAQVESTANANPDFLLIKGSAYQPVSVQHAEDILSKPLTAVSTAISNLPVSTNAKTALADFSTAFLQLCRDTDDYGLVYAHITGTEESIVADKYLTAYDKKVMLTVTSLVRHSQSRRKKPKRNTDLDWEHNVFHLTGSIEGSGTGPAEAITRALTLGIAENH